jgi:hypothetical protein
MSDIYRNYLLDLGRYVRDAGTTAKTDTESASDDDRQFQQGRRMAYYEVLSLMQQRAATFNLPLGDLFLDGFDADHDLL